MSISLTSDKNMKCIYNAFVMLSAALHWSLLRIDRTATAGNFLKLTVHAQSICKADVFTNAVKRLTTAVGRLFE